MVADKPNITTAIKYDSMLANKKAYLDLTLTVVRECLIMSRGWCGMSESGV